MLINRDRMGLHKESYAMMGQKFNSVSSIVMWLFFHSFDLFELGLSPEKWDGGGSNTYFLCLTGLLQGTDVIVK